jgi:nucleoid DNA-binding protein
MITDEYRIKKNMRALIDVMRIISTRTTIDFESNIVKVEFQANLKGLDDRIENKTQLNLIDLGTFTQNHRILTSGITPQEYKIMHRQLVGFQSAENECEVEGIGVRKYVV